MESLLYPISDALQMDLDYRAKGKVLAGQMNRDVKLDKDVTFPVKLSAVASFVNKKEAQAGVLCHVAGHLYVLMCHKLDTRAVSCYLVDSSRLGLKRLQMVDCLPHGTTIREAVKQLRPGITASFSRKAMAADWQPLTLPQEL